MTPIELRFLFELNEISLTGVSEPSYFKDYEKLYGLARKGSSTIYFWNRPGIWSHKIRHPRLYTEQARNKQNTEMDELPPQTSRKDMH